MALPAPDNDYGKAAVATFTDIVKRDGTVVTGVQAYREPATDFSAEVAALDIAPDTYSKCRASG